MKDMVRRRKLIYSFQGREKQATERGNSLITGGGKGIGNDCPGLCREAEARKRFDAGMSVEGAIADIDLGQYATWGEKERIAVNVAALFKEFRNDVNPLNTLELFGLMARMTR
jgi:hypothetical protein